MTAVERILNKGNQLLMATTHFLLSAARFAVTENKTTYVTTHTHVNKLTTRNNVFIVSVIV